MAPPRALIALIQRFEGCFLAAYLCPARVWTCGWGSTGPDVTAATRWTREQADARLMLDAQAATIMTAKLCPKADGDELAALADFTYNLGATRLAGSTLRRKFNAGDLAGARREIRRWVYGGGRKLPGLVLRRAAEEALLR
jgi:lysozyme